MTLGTVLAVTFSDVRLPVPGLLANVLPVVYIARFVCSNAGLWGWIFWLPGRNTPVRMSSGGGGSEGPSGSKASHPHPLRALLDAVENLDDFRP